MSTSFLHSDRAAPAAPRFAELAVVALRHPLTVEVRTLPAGSTGTVVAVYADSEAYEVEFDTPFHAVVTLEAADLISA